MWHNGVWKPGAYFLNGVLVEEPSGLLSDGFHGWLKERVTPDKAAKVSAKDAYQSYKAWCERAGEWVLSPKRFGQMMCIGSGFARYRTSEGRYYIGLRLNAGPEEI